MLRILLFTGIIAAATILDIYYNENPVEINTTENDSKNAANEPAEVYLFSPAGYSAAKTSVQKNPGRKHFEQHTKFLQRYHETKNFRELKTEEKKPTNLQFLSFHYLIFRNHYFSLPDDDPHLS